MLNPTPTSEIRFLDEKALLDEEALLAINLFIKKTGERKVDVESLKKLEYSQKQEKAEELTQEIDYIKTQTQKLFGELRNKIKQLIPQIIAQTKKEEITAKALKEFSTTITEIITKIEEEYSKKPEEFAQDKNPIEGIITKILEGATEVDPQFKQLFLYDPDSTKKILTQILKETVIKKIITEIKEEVSIDSQTEERETDSFGKIITRIKQEDSLINKYYEEDPVSILKIIARLEFEKADENPIEKIINQILEEKEKAFKAIAEDPLGQIIIEHKIEKANSPQKEEADTKKIVVKGQEVKTQIYSNINQEIVEQILFKDEAELPITKSVKKEILDAYQDRSKIENESKKTTFLSKFSAKIPQKKRNTILVSSDSGIKSDIVFVKLDESLDLIQAEEKLAEKEKDGKDLDEKRLLIYAELIAKIPQEYSESISPTHQEIIYLKKQEKGHKKTLNFLKGLIQEEERIAEEITKIEKTVDEIAKDIAEERKLYFAEQERIDAEKRVEISVQGIRNAFEIRISEGRLLSLEGQEAQIIRTLTTNSQSLIKTKTDIDRKVREILSSEYVNEKLENVPEESAMRQLLIEAIIVDEARKKLNPDEIKEIKSKLNPKSPDSTFPEVDKKALNLLIIQKALEKILKLEQQKNNSDYLLNDDSEIIVPAIENIDTPQNKLNFFKPNNQLNLDALALLELKEQSTALNKRLAEINIELKKQSGALEERLAEINALEEKIAPPASELSSLNLENENASRVVEEPSDEMTPRIMEGENRSSNPPNDPLSAGGDFAQVQVAEKIPSLSEQSNLGLPSSEKDYQLEPQQFTPQKSKKKLGLPPTSANSLSSPEHKSSLTAVSVPTLSLDGIGPTQGPPTQLSSRTEKNEFWQAFIGTKLATSAQNSPRNDANDLDQNLCDSQNLSASSTPRSKLSDLQEEEIEKRKKGLYAILMNILENQSPIKSESDSKNEEIYIEEGDKEVAKDNLEAVMAHIANYTLNLLLSISQTKGALPSEPSESQTTQNFSTDDPIIYSGIGIRIKLEKEENGEYSLKITEVFENSRLEKEAVNKKITHVKCGDELKSITAIYEDCKGYEEKFYTKIALIFRDEKQEKLTLKIEGEKHERNVVKNIFIPEDKKGLNIYDNSQMTKIAEKLIASRQNFSQLTTSRGGKVQTA